jgi:hypothetical protein
MKVQNWDRWHQEKDTVGDVVDRFSRTCSGSNAPNYAYEAGWWSSMVKRLLMEVPRAQREREIRYLEDQIRKMEAQQIVSALTKRQ